MLHPQLQIMIRVFVFSVHVLKDTDLPLEVASALGPDVQFVLKYVDVGEFISIDVRVDIKHYILSTAI